MDGPALVGAGGGVTILTGSVFGAAVVVCGGVVEVVVDAVVEGVVVAAVGALAIFDRSTSDVYWMSRDLSASTVRAERDSGPTLGSLASGRASDSVWGGGVIRSNRAGPMEGQSPDIKVRLQASTGAQRRPMQTSLHRDLSPVSSENSNVFCPICFRVIILNGGAVECYLSLAFCRGTLFTAFLHPFLRVELYLRCLYIPWKFI